MKALKQFIAHITRTQLSLIGSVMTTVAAVAFVGLFLYALMGFEPSPYVGILAFLVLPLFFVIGLLLIALGLYLDRRRRRKPGGPPPPVVIDLGNPVTRRKMRIFVIATLLNMAIILLAAFKGVEVMETNEFCGETCHKVMHPEFTSYQGSPHARVRCVSCHIGPGANWFVKSKISGSWQVVSVTLDLYPRPIPTPIHNLRPARETCEQCHWPAKFVGDRLKVISRFQEDEANTELKTVMMLKVGGRRANESRGIHWHVDPRHSVRYRSDPTRETVYEVEMVEEGKPTQRWVGPEASKPEAAAATTWRTMDCVDCHNRPAHTYRSPEDEIDQAFADGRLDRTMPFLRREALKAVKADYKTTEEVRAGIEQALATFYKGQPAITPERVAGAASVLAELRGRNVFPLMKIGWNTYPNHLSHVVGMGCLRCHNGDHKTADGTAIASDCDSCHAILADSEQDPEILKTLQP